MLDFDHDELMVTKTIYQQSRKIILIADANKFERKAPYVTAHLKDVDTFVTDKKPSKEIVSVCKKNNVELIISPPNF